MYRYFFSDYNWGKFFFYIFAFHETGEFSGQLSLSLFIEHHVCEYKILFDSQI